LLYAREKRKLFIEEVFTQFPSLGVATLALFFIIKKSSFQVVDSMPPALNK